MKDSLGARVEEMKQKIQTTASDLELVSKLATQLDQETNILKK